jgi:transcriptional regulator with XRE-family HTH domain
MNFGPVLARQRRARGWSQSALSDASGVSQRHISFLESGRAKPGRAATAQLVAALAQYQNEADALLIAAGLRAPPETRTWLDPAFADVRTATALLIDSYDPWPAVICDRSGAIFSRNAAFDRILALVGGNALLDTTGCNLHDLTLHSEGLFPLMVNPEDIVPHTMLRLRRAATVDSGAARTLARVRRWDSVQTHGHLNASTDSSVLNEIYQIGQQKITIHSMTTCFGCPEDAAAQAIQIELFLPADPETRALFRTLADSYSSNVMNRLNGSGR